MARPRLAFLVTVSIVGAVTLAGCLGGDDETPKDPAVSGDGPSSDVRFGPRPSVEGNVRDVEGAPLPGTEVSVQNENLSAVTNATGYYSFNGLADNQLYVLIASLEGFGRVAQQFVAIDDKVIQLDFALEPIPKERPRVDVIDRSGLLGCELDVIVADNEVRQGCGGPTGQDPNAAPTLDVAIPPDVVGIVVEVAWESTQPLSDFLQIEAETTGFGDLDTRLGSVVGPSPVKIDVAQGNVAKYYTEAGGTLRVGAAAHPEDDDEAAGGAAFAFQQSFTVYVSLFFVEPNGPTYTALEG